MGIGVLVGLLLLDERNLFIGFGSHIITIGLTLDRLVDNNVDSVVVASSTLASVGFKVVVLLDSPSEVASLDGMVPLQQTSDFPQGLPYSFNCKTI